MKAMKLCLIILIAAVVINFIKDEQLFHISKVLPFSNRPEPVGMYDWAGVAALAICAWGLYRLSRNRRNHDE